MSKTISIVSPAFNEEKNIPLLHKAVAEVFAKLKGYDFELVFVNDGSRDNTWAVISKLGTDDTRVQGLSFTRNFGNQYAIEAGIHVARGDAVILMDCDLEHPPELIPTLIAKWEEGYEVVHTTRRSYCQRSWFKRKTSILFYKLFNMVSDMPIDDSASDYLLMDKKVVTTLRRIHEVERFYRGLIRWLGFYSTTVEYDAAQRIHGESGYTFKKLMALAWTSLISFSTLPMRTIIMLGSMLAISSTLLLIIMSILRFGFDSEYFSQMAFLVVTIIGSNGVTLMALGIMAMYILRIHKEVHGRPNYIVHRSVNLHDVEIK